MREDFHATADPINVEYNEQRGKNPEKNHVFKNYMKYLESEILRCNANIALKEKHFEKAEQYKMKASQLIDEMLKEEKFLKPYLLPRAKRNQELLAN